MRKARRNLFITVGLVTLYSVMKIIAKKKSESTSINDDNPYINHAAEKDDHDFSASIFGANASYPYPGRSRKVSIYEAKVKPILDQVLSFSGLVLLSPLFGLISLAVYIDDPGTVFFTQKRVGKDKTYFMCHKFRSMRMSTPHDVPTHQLENPDQYITKVGRVLRRTSLDELPQIWDIFRQRMSVIGPRPALWNQDDLVAERDKYCANSVMPGLTGLAQIRGRDELEIEEKAKIDGEYVKKLSFLMDVKCFWKTIGSVLRSDGVVEGGTGEIDKHEVRG